MCERRGSRAKQRGSPRREEVERETTEPGTQRPLRREVETQSNPSVARTNRGGWEGKRKRLEEEEELEVDEDEDEAETGNEMWQCRLDIRDLVYTGEIHERSLCLLPLPCLTLRPARKLASPELAARGSVCVGVRGDRPFRPLGFSAQSSGEVRGRRRWNAKRPNPGRKGH
ncbi:hypothetical protein C8R46DRAFT_1037724 [Mycena filopes]|nr:hypothetical protein C8R46DRAFT_1037724 [Mycena filopes]